VALGFAVHLINASALTEFARAVRTVNGDADVQVHAVTPFGFEEALYPKLARLDGVVGASPAVELQATADARGDVRITLLGLDGLRAGFVTPSLIGRRVEISSEGGDNPLDESALFLSQAALDAVHKSIGDTITLSAAGHDVGFKIEGTLPGVADGQSIGAIDIAAAQWRFGQLGRLQRIDLKFADGADPERMRDAVARLLPGDAEIVTQESQARRSDALSRAYRVNLDMLALMALLSGAFLVYSAQSLSVARRRSQFALLRVLGVRRRALLAQVLAEGIVVGGIGAVLGLVLGLALASAALSFLGGDLGGGYFQGTRPRLIFAPVAAAAFLVLGLAAALFGSLLPAREAARAQPAVALKNEGDVIDPKAVPAVWTAPILLVLGAGAALLPAIGDLPVFGYLSIALMLAGGVAAMPLLARLLLAPLQRFAFRAAAIDLALKRLWGAPSQAAIALCGIVASTSLMVAMAVMIASFRISVDEWMVQVLPSDLYLHLEGDTAGGLDPAMQAKLAAVPGIAHIDFRKITPLRLKPDQPPIAVMARTVDFSTRDGALPLIGASLPVPQGAVPVWVSEPGEWLYGYAPGDTIALPIGRGVGEPPRVFIAGIWRDYARQQGSIVIDNKDYTRLAGDRLRTDAAVDLAPGARPRQVIEALRAALPPALAARLTVAEPQELRALAMQIFDRSFAVTYLLEAIAILVGLSGVAATFSAQTLARTKEFGMLRHVGVLKRQIVAMLAVEGAALGIVGVVAGIGLGLAISQVLINVVNPQSFHWSMETRLPYGLFATVTIVLVAAAAGTALFAGRRALSGDAVRAVREDW
jgi:putative ABC transport system permease protein